MRINTLNCAMMGTLFLFHGYKIFAHNVQHPNIIWITCEDICPYLGCYGCSEVKTPNIDKFAKEGMLFQNAYTISGVSAPSRSSLITGMYPMSIGTQNMRTTILDPKNRVKGLPNYSAVIPSYVKCFPEYLRMNGYYTTNNLKQDYQFNPPVTVWDESSPAASYRNDVGKKPFFSVWNLFVTHESQLMAQKRPLTIDPKTVTVPPYYKDTPTVRHDIARMLSNVEVMDHNFGEIIKQLKKDGVYDNSYIFFYADNGGTLPWMKREILERGTHIPLIIKFPKGMHAGTVDSDMISEIDFAPTVLSLANVKIPQYFQGQAFLGSQASKTKRKYVYAARDRMDNKYDRARSVRDSKFRYIYNYMPERPSYQNLRYRMGIPMMREMLLLHEEGDLDSIQDAWFKVPKQREELYDEKNDIYEIHNLANNPKYHDKLVELRQAFRKWTGEVGDMSYMPEKEMVENWWGGKDKAPVTATPVIVKTKNGVRVSCSTEGASIGYRILKPGEKDKMIQRIIWSRDMFYANGVKGKLDGDIVNVSSPYTVYQGGTIKLRKGETLIVNAMRIGYSPAIVKYIY